MKTKLIALAALTLALGAAAPSMAKDATGDSGVDTVVNGVMFVPRAGAAVVGVVVGTPIAVARETWKSYKTWTPEWADKVGGHESAPACVLASVASVPASIVWGTCTGAYYGTRNGLVHGFNAPFTADSFSLGKETEQ